ncbi:MAG: helix-turn-helix domain-containing protein [Gemmatimonadales bacterium]
MPDRLRTCRRLRGLSQNRLACLFQVDESTLARWERGTRRPSPADLTILQPTL